MLAINTQMCDKYVQISFRENVAFFGYCLVLFKF